MKLQKVTDVKKTGTTDDCSYVPMCCWLVDFFHLKHETKFSSHTAIELVRYILKFDFA